MNNYRNCFRASVLGICLTLFAACSGDRLKTESIPGNPEPEVPDSLLHPATTSSTLNSIEDIQKEYDLITVQRNNGLLDSTVFSYNCKNETTGVLSFFSRNGKLQLIVHRYNEYDHHAAIDLYFIKDSSLFFAYTKTILWAFDPGLEGSTKDNITERRIYIINNQPARCLEKKYVVRSQMKSNPVPETVANKELPCTTFGSVSADLELLLKYRYRSATGCL